MHDSVQMVSEFRRKNEFPKDGNDLITLMFAGSEEQKNELIKSNYQLGRIFQGIYLIYFLYHQH